MLTSTTNTHTETHSKGRVLSFRPDDGTECFLMQ
jgi:hypothetical protein